MKASFDWQLCAHAVTEFYRQKLAEWRGYSREFCAWLQKQGLIGMYDGKWALPVHDDHGTTIAVHYRTGDENGQQPGWFYFPKGQGSRALVIGDLKSAGCIWIFESQWDAFAVMDKLRWHRRPWPDTAIVITRGAANGKIVRGMFRPGSAAYAFKQNDDSKNGRNPADQWLADICAHTGCKVLYVATPVSFKDANDWTRSGATGADIADAIQDAKLVHEPLTFAGDRKGGESVESVETDATPVPAQESLSTFSTGGHSLDQAVYPVGSWLERYMDFARLREESADSYLIGSIVPVVGAALGRRISFPWSEGWIYPNLFSMLAGKPGDRKSSAINQAERVARAVLANNHFLPHSLSAEALFDEYDDERGGSPDKLLIADDANPFLGLIQKAQYGERVGEQLLRLYDCKGLTESFRRNKTGESETPRRCITATSTSIIFGATFNICQFQGHAIRSGLQRRFNYYLAERHGRLLVLPAKSNPSELSTVTDRLIRLAALPDRECAFSPEAAELWEKFQRENRAQLHAMGINQESHLARLNGQPAHVLKLAMIFQVAIWAESSNEFAGVIELATLEKAIEHSEHCVASAQALDAIGNRATIEADADVLLANIHYDFADKKQHGVILLTRTELTSRYAHHSGRRGQWKPHDLYQRLIPDLIRRRKAKEIPRPGKQSAFALKVEEDL